jgi:hypothetical protein
MPDTTIDYEHYPPGQVMDEADVSARYHVAQFSDQKLAEYDPSWTDDQLMEWDGNFRNDGNLMLICTERDIDVNDYREVLEQHIDARRKNGAKI